MCAFDGLAVGQLDGEAFGLKVRVEVLGLLLATVGDIVVGVSAVGLLEGTSLGAIDGTALGFGVVGDTGAEEGALVGLTEGSPVGTAMEDGKLVAL